MLQIRDLSSAKAKSLLRGRASFNRNKRKGLELSDLRSLSQYCSDEEIIELLTTNPMFGNFEFEDDFPNFSTMVYSLGDVQARNAQSEIEFQGIRFKLQSQRIVSALDSIANINEGYIENKPKVVLDGLQRHHEDFGYSLVMLRKIALALAYFEDEELKSYCMRELARYRFHKRNIVALSSVDMVGDSQDYATIRRTLLEYCSSSKVNTPLKEIIEAQFDPICCDQSEFSRRLLAVGQISLIDAVFFCCLHGINTPVIESFDLTSTFESSIGSEITSAWLRLSKMPVPDLAQASSLEDLNRQDYTSYRRSVAWIESRIVSRYRLSVDSLFADKETLPCIRSLPQQDFAKAYFEGLSSIHQLTNKSEQVNIQWEHFNNSCSGVFTRTLAVTYLMREEIIDSKISTDSLLALMDGTVDLVEVTQPEELKTLFSKSEKGNLSSYIAAAVISDCTGTKTDQHRFRRALQQIVMSDLRVSLTILDSTLIRSDLDNG